MVLKTAMQAAFERAWLKSDDKRVIRQAIRVIVRQERQAAERKARRAKRA